MLRFFKYLFLLSFAVIILTASAAGLGLYYLVVVNPGPEIKQENIERILARESHVFYSDATTKIGVLFEDFHRRYITFEQIPEYFINAIIAAEDRRFFSHFGFDPAGILRAAIANFRAGRIVQGGSTITQQTAKNLFKREGRTYRAKLKELLFALRLEYHYSKEQILEFYTNLFFVSGTGHGLGIAARYYFDKEPAELDLLEAAFIAGSVKRPNWFNIFTKKSPELVAITRERGRIRTHHVLGSMLREQMITREMYDEAIGREIIFNRGTTIFPVNTVMDMIKEGLATDTVIAALEEHGIFNVATSGIRIIASIDQKIQSQSEYALRRHLSYLDVILKGYDRDEVQNSYADMRLTTRYNFYPQDFFLAKIASIKIDEENKNQVSIQVGLADGTFIGTIDRQGLERTLTAFVKNKRDRWTEVNDKRDVPLLLAELKEGDRVFVSVRTLTEDGALLLDLEKYPEIQGAAVVMREGSIIAMVGGMENRFYNRAVQARRLMGSTLKPFLFAAAMQLGWSSVDLLDNRRNVFTFMGKPYFPRPNHKAPSAQSSMSWAGVTSENLATVWLLYHLTDKLNPSQLVTLAEFVDMAPRINELGQEESYRSFSTRMRDEFGIRVNKGILREAAYELAVKNLEADFLFDDRADEHKRLRLLPYGLDFDRFTNTLLRELQNKNLTARQRQERYLRLSILDNSFLGLKSMSNVLQGQQLYFSKLLSREETLLSIFMTEPKPSRPAGRLALDEEGHIVLSLKSRLPDNWLVLDDEAVLVRLRKLDPPATTIFWDSVLFEGVVSRWGYVQITNYMEQEYARLLNARPYSMEVLSAVSDYRVMLGLQYLIKFGRASGIESELEPVLSFPLGSNVMTLIESVRMYETLVRGFRYDPEILKGTMDRDVLPMEEQRDALAMIKRIESQEGEVLFVRSTKPVAVLDSKTAASVTNMLENAVRHGTGRYAWRNVRLISEDQERNQQLQKLDLPVPLMGKTGTSDQFRNASFFGFVPVADVKKGVMVIDNGYAVGVYVGYDDNKPMVNRTNRISGASGALPIWSDIASALLIHEQVADRLDIADLAFNGLALQYSEVNHFVPVDPQQGGKTLEGRGALRTNISPERPAILSHGHLTPGGRFEPERLFQPFWKNEEKTMEN